MKQDDVINNFQNIAMKYHEILMTITHRKGNSPYGMIFNKDKMQKISARILEKMQEKPEDFSALNIEYAQKFNVLMTNTLMKFIGEDIPSIFSPHKGDKRFKDEAWNQNIYFDFIKQFYLMSSNLIKKHISNLGFEPQTQRIVEFLSNQFTNAFCPSNFAFSNPEVFKESMMSGWNNITQGMDNFLEDLKNSDGMLNINTTDKMFFKLGQNIAATPGKVVLQNDLMQLIAYEPTSEVHQTPILIIPPCINKYYILDLSPENSFVKWLVNNNFQVFLVSWVNPDKHLSDMDLGDYVKQGVLDTIDYICKDLGYNKISTIGYCIGGTVLGIALGHMAKEKIDLVESAAFMATLLDFSNPGDIGLFINEDILDAFDEELNHKGYFDGKYLTQSFSLLRANDLIWSFFVNNYLLGRRPLPFDILYWNSDPTNLPAQMFRTYMKELYLGNKLVSSDGINILDTKIDLKNINIPTFFLSCKDDHITLWQSTFKGMQAMGGKKTFCLTTSGHVAGIVNPPHNRKYSYYYGGDITHTPDKFIETSTETQGSWWPKWMEWCKSQTNNTLIPETKYAKFNSISQAPGSYVKVCL